MRSAAERRRGRLLAPAGAKTIPRQPPRAHTCPAPAPALSSCSLVPQLDKHNARRRRAEMEAKTLLELGGELGPDSDGEAWADEGPAIRRPSEVSSDAGAAASTLTFTDPASGLPASLPGGLAFGPQLSRLISDGRHPPRPAPVLPELAQQQQQQQQQQPFGGLQLAGTSSLQAAVPRLGQNPAGLLPPALQLPPLRQQGECGLGCLACLPCLECCGRCRAALLAPHLLTCGCRSLPGSSLPLTRCCSSLAAHCRRAAAAAAAAQRAAGARWQQRCRQAAAAGAAGTAAFAAAEPHPAAAAAADGYDPASRYHGAATAAGVAASSGVGTLGASAAGTAGAAAAQRGTHNPPAGGRSSRGAGRITAPAPASAAAAEWRARRLCCTAHSAPRSASQQ